MSIKEILAIEAKREDQKAYLTIHLHQEGNFLRAYEWSAWLCYRHMKDFKVTRRMVKSVQTDVLFIGFPPTSLEKWLPSGAQVIPVDDKNLDICLDESVLPSPFDVDLFKADFEEWRESFPVTEMPVANNNPSGKGDTSTPSPSAGKMGLMDVAHKILEFPLERKSPLECYEFIGDLKQQLTWIF